MKGLIDINANVPIQETQKQFSVIVPESMVDEIDAYCQEKEETEGVAWSRNHAVVVLLHQALRQRREGGKRK
jgi:hypothetical protein